jgi:hypothetical protein
MTLPCLSSFTHLLLRVKERTAPFSRNARVISQHIGIFNTFFPPAHRNSSDFAHNLGLIYAWGMEELGWLVLPRLLPGQLNPLGIAAGADGMQRHFPPYLEAVCHLLKAVSG